MEIPENAPSRRSYLKALGATLTVGAAAVGFSRLDRGPAAGAGPDDRNRTDTPTNRARNRTGTPATGTPSTPAGDGSAADTADGAAAGVFDLVDDLGADPAGNEPVTSRIEDAMAPGTRIAVPPGTYRLAPRPIDVPADNVEFVATDDEGDATWKLADGYHGPFLRCEKDGFRFQGIDIDMSGTAQESGHMRLQAPSGFHVEDVDFIGRGRGPGYAFQAAITDDPDGVGVLRSVRVPHGSRPDRYAPLGGDKGNGRIGVFTGLTHYGTLRIEDCVFSEFGNNGIYASRTHGDVRVEDSYFLNNAPNGIRLSGAGSWAKRCTVEIDFDKYDGPPTTTEWLAWGISCENAREGSTLAEYPPEDPGMVVEECEVLLREVDGNGRVGAGVRLASKARAMTVRDSHIRVDTERGLGRSTHAVLRVNPFLTHRKYRSNAQNPPEPHALTLENVTVTGSAADGTAVRISHAADSTVENCRIEQTGADRDGVLLLESPNCRIAGGSIETPGYPVVITARSKDDCLVSFAESPEFTSTGSVDTTELSGVSSTEGALRVGCRALAEDGDGDGDGNGKEEDEDGLTAMEKWAKKTGTELDVDGDEDGSGKEEGKEGKDVVTVRIARIDGTALYGNRSG